MKTGKDLRILGLILARGGSKRLPGKNIKPLLGKPLISWSIEASLACSAICRTVVSTDSQAIADLALAAGADVPFIRPAALAEDSSTSADAALHAINYLRDREGQEFDALILLEPTSPLRASGDLAGVADRLAARWGDADAVVTVGAVRLEQPTVMKALGDDGFISSWLADCSGSAQKRLPTAWFPYGVAYAVKVSALEQWRTFYPPRVLGYPIQTWQNYEVDDEFDFLCVESVMSHIKGKIECESS